MKGRVLIVAGSDSGGGAGIQADIKAVTALNGFAMTAVTALTAQNTLGVHDVLPVDPGFIRTQMRVVLDDLGADCLKTGMLHSSEVIEAVCEVAETEAAGIPLVVDPVMVAKGGAALLGIEAVAAMRDRLLPLSRVITPNIPEAERLLDMEIGTLDAMKRDWHGQALQVLPCRIQGLGTEDEEEEEDTVFNSCFISLSFSLILFVEPARRGNMIRPIVVESCERRLKKSLPC